MQKLIGLLLLLLGLTSVEALQSYPDSMDPLGLRVIAFGQTFPYPGDLAKARSHFTSLLDAIENNTAATEPVKTDVTLDSENGYEKFLGQLHFVDVVAASGSFDAAVNWACLQESMPSYIRWQLAYKAAELGNVEAFGRLRTKFASDDPSSLKRLDKASFAVAIRRNRGEIISSIVTTIGLRELNMSLLADDNGLCVVERRSSFSFPPYVLAARYGADKAIRALFKAGVRYEDDGGNSCCIDSGFFDSAMFHAIRRGDLDLFRLLLRLRAVQENPWEFIQSNPLDQELEPYSGEDTATSCVKEKQWRRAAVEDGMNFFSCLVKSTLAPDSDVFALACLGGDYEIVGLLLPLVREYLRTHPNDPRPIFSRFSSILMLNRAIMYAALENDERLVGTLMNLQDPAGNKTDINAGPYIPHLKVLKLNVEEDPYREGPYADSYRSIPNSGINRWTVYQARQALEMLATRGAKMDVLDDLGRSAWHYVVHSHRAEGISALAREFLEGVPVDTVDQSGETPLHALVKRVAKPTDETMMLLDMLITERTVNIPDKKGRLPIDYEQHGAILIKLLERGGDVNHVKESAKKPWGIDCLESWLDSVTRNYLSYTATARTAEELRNHLEDRDQLYFLGFPRLDGVPPAQSLDERLEFLTTSIPLVLRGLNIDNFASAKQIISDFAGQLATTTDGSIESIVAAFDSEEPGASRRRASTFINANRLKVSGALTRLLSAL